MPVHIDIHKAGGIIIQDGKLLVTRSHGKAHFIMPGGKLENNETAKQALVRELREELQLNISETDLELFGTYRATAADAPDKIVEMTVFIVHDLSEAPVASSEIAELAWIDSKPTKFEVGSIVLHDVLPSLLQRELIA